MSSRFGASNPRYTLEIKGLGIETRIVSFHAIEGISEPFEVNLTIAASAANPLSFEKISECEALLTVYSYEDAYGIGTNTRYFHGVVNKLKYAGIQGSYCLYRIRLVPYLWFLNLSHNSRIFQDKSIEQICTEIFNKTKMQGKFKFILNLPKNKEPKSYCVQYNESNFDFVARILEEAGIFYIFEHSIESHQAVFTDMTVHCDVIKGDDEIPLGHPNEDNPNQETVIAFNLSERFVTGKFSHTSYNFDNASQKLDVTKAEENPGQHEHYIHDGTYESEADGEIIASIRLEEASQLEQRAKGISSCARFTPGYKFSLDSDVNSEFVDEYILLAVEHKGEQPQVLEEDGQAGGSPEYENGFLCVPSDTQIRPPRTTPKPVITGLQSAIVTGPKGEEIHTDKYGRITVQFHWDRLGKKDDNSSCWLRVAQTWGGGGWGAQFIPRIGDEVLVDFLEGDPDRPIVTGCVYNSDNLPINSLEKSKTQSGFRTKTHKGEGFNELRFDDATGAQEVYIHGEKDFKVTIKNNETKTIGNNLVNQVGKTATITAGKQLQLICGSASIVLDQSGKIVIHGTEVFVSGNTLHLDGKPIQMNMGGAAGIAATLIPVEAAASAAGGKVATSTKAETSKKKPEHKKVTKEDMKNADNKVTQTYGKDIPENKRTPSAFDRSALEDNKTFHENGGGEENAYYHPLWNKIHINSDKANIGTPIHEDLHYYSSDKFGKTFGKDLDEGTTEYFTRKTTDFDRTGIYQKQYKDASDIAKSVGEQKLKDAYFKGDASAISDIQKHLSNSSGKPVFSNYPSKFKEVITSDSLL